ncbi:MAG TPA: Mur ligase family protein, partial [Thermomicrobiales bacterium]|nr:Mur ligase family protein [Thermomicrobiales bacterium]
ASARHSVELIEIRDLDGPNLFLLEPAIKVEFRGDAADYDPSRLTPLRERLGLAESHGQTGLAACGAALCDAVVHLHDAANLPKPVVTWERLETPGHIAVIFGWYHRRAAMKLASLLAALALGETVDRDQRLAQIRDVAATTDDDDEPLMVRDADRKIPIIGITGTNGKTTTTRLTAHILRSTGRYVGYCSSSGVHVGGEQVLTGDYTGPSGALRVLHDPNVQVAVLETARGGILLRGVAYESDDVGVFTNLSADHLDLQGIRTLEGLLRVKSTVVRVTRSDGYAVLNADDDLVRSLANQLRARVFYISQDASNPVLVEHIRAGGRALFVRNGEMIQACGQDESPLIAVDAIPITLGGRARHMVENALCAAAACLAVGLSENEVRAGLETFSNDPEHNFGRLNIFKVNDVTVVVDFAHNEAGLRHLLALAHDLGDKNGRIISIIGTAGDRTDASLRAIGRIAADQSDRVYIKETAKYLRGRSNNDELNQRYVQGIETAQRTTPWSVEESELAAVKTALQDAQTGDVIAMMCVELIPEVIAYLQELEAARTSTDRPQFGQPL